VTIYQFVSTFSILQRAIRFEDLIKNIPNESSKVLQYFNLAESDNFRKYIKTHTRDSSKKFVSNMYKKNQFFCFVNKRPENKAEQRVPNFERPHKIVRGTIFFGRLKGFNFDFFCHFLLFLTKTTNC
jgi:hypothetical protein